MQSRTDTDEPNLVIVNTEMEEPKRENERKERLDPRCKKSKTESDEPNRARAKTETLEPLRAKLRNDKDEPRCV